MQVQFCGANGEVTGSSHLLTIGARHILLDCGMIQGDEEIERRNAEPFPFDPQRLDALILSHAHIDHIGRVPLLVKRGFRGPIYAQAATADLSRIMLEDSAAIAESDIVRDNLKRLQQGLKPEQPLYTRKDAQAALEQVRPLAYDTALEIFPQVYLRLRDAGHILGSSVVEIWQDKGSKLVFSGDIGPRGTPILRDPAAIDGADAVLMESTYGNRLHRSRSDTVAELGGIFAAARNSGGNVVIPAFAVGRSQELLYWMAEHFDDWQLGDFRIFLDSPMAGKVLAVYERHEELFDTQARALWARRPHPLRLPNLQVTESVAESQAINQHRGGAIIIAGSGMCNGGRIRHHLRHHLGRHDAHIVFVGYQAQGTLGRLLVDGVKRVKLFGDTIDVHAHRHTVGGLSAHADQAGLLDWYAAIGTRAPVYLVHGEDIAREALAEKLRTHFRCRVELSMPGMQVLV
ncbi:metallo-beta-lactamase family protein [Tahibacter aquaticus]|uniref:Metallo-beta-lactamase family protein n=1 Tax=Tahibacter aquaticus TaxID=520092 RepID=A0A4R6Z9H9_9GAMM|nr:MBL fold metallo-hydrolase [Tahibacter aquaticus]TDR48452.1 metallo-beta-lactamase family protein [Tahibacter aquaticus]